MEKDEVLTPAKAANHLIKITKVFHDAHGSERFPINIDQLALGAAEIFRWPDPITKIHAENIKNFEGMLASNENRSKWILAYNKSLSSTGRIRFTKAHELGHYVLHRKLKNEFMCAKEDMLEWSSEGNIESEADIFASYLLMPLDDFRSQVGTSISLDVFSHCAERYGVSLTAAILKWLSYTDQKAIIVMSNDGFMNWASSSDPAFKSGAFFKTRDNTIPIPESSLAADESVTKCAEGRKVPAKIWFPNADTDSELLEMKCRNLDPI